MEVIRFVVDETAYACWDWELTRKNLEFIEGIDAEYFRYVAEINAEHLEGENKHRAALALRLAYSQGLETLFALLCSMVQAPQCVVGWMLSYENKELQRLVQKITGRSPVYSKLKEKPITWELLARYVHSHVGYSPEKIAWIQKGFGDLWLRFAGDFTSVQLTEEYNSAKHGLRTRLGGFSLCIGEEEIAGIPAPPEKMLPLGGSTFGTSYFTKEKIIDGKRLNFRPREQLINWHPEGLICGLLLLSMSINNVVSFLRIINKTPAEKCRFLTPINKEAFEVQEKNMVIESNLST